MKKLTNKLFYLSILIISFLSCKTETKTEIENLEQTKTEKIDSLANRYLELNRFSGTILVSKNETIVYNQSFGMADYENMIPFSNKTVFKIGEITQFVTENILSRLSKNGRIELTDKLSKHLVEIKSDVTINDVINQKSDINYNTLGRLIEKVSEKSYQQNVDEYSSDLGLENTYFDKKNSNIAVGYLYHNYRGKGLELQKSPTYDLDITYSNKGLKSTGNDLIKILKTNPKELNISGYLDNDGFSYSLVNDTEKNTSIIVLSNRKQPITEEISNSIKAILENKEYVLPLSRKPIDIDKAILKNFSGNYSINENVSFEVLNTNDSLFVLMGPNKIYLVPQSSNQFYMEQMDASMKFMKDSTGIINRIILLNGFINSDEQAVRIK